MTIDRKLYKKYKGRFPDPDGRRADAFGTLGLMREERKRSLDSFVGNLGRFRLLCILAISITAIVILVRRWAW